MRRKWSIINSCAGTTAMNWVCFRKSGRTVILAETGVLGSLHQACLPFPAPLILFYLQHFIILFCDYLLSLSPQNRCSILVTVLCLCLRQCLHSGILRNKYLLNMYMTFLLLVLRSCEDMIDTFEKLSSNGIHKSYCYRTKCSHL